MSRATRLAKHIQRTAIGPMWHGPALAEVLEGVDAAGARARPIAGAHSIWEIVLHIAAWKRAGSRMLSGEDVNVNPEEDWPPIPEEGNSAWEQALEALGLGHRQRLEQQLVEQ